MNTVDYQLNELIEQDETDLPADGNRPLVQVENLQALAGSEFRTRSKNIGCTFCGHLGLFRFTQVEFFNSVSFEMFPLKKIVSHQERKKTLLRSDRKSILTGGM